MRITAISAASIAALILAACSNGGTAPTSLLPIGTPAPPPVVANTYTTGVSSNAAFLTGVSGPDGRIWFTEFNAGNLAAVTTSGTVTEYPVGPVDPNGLVVGPDGNLWIGAYGHEIDKVTVAGAVTHYPVAGSHIGQMVIGPDHNIWFFDYGNNKIGYITTAGAVTEFALAAGADPCAIATGPDGNLWLSDCGNGGIDKISTAGTLLGAYTTGLSTPLGVTAMLAAQDGAIYFTEAAFSPTINDHVGKITTAGVITELGTLSPQSYPYALTIGKNGSLYFSEYEAARLGKISASGVTETALTLASGQTGTSGIVAGPDQRLWLTSFNAIYAVTY